MTTEDITTLEADVRAKLAAHDWYYAYADDGEARRQGQRSYTEASAAFQRYLMAVGAKQAAAVWNECAPAAFHLAQQGDAS